MAKFNSLGSNFTFKKAWQVLTIRGQKRDEQIVKAQLKSMLDLNEQAQVEFFYKGREALRAALKSLNLQEGTRVAIVGFTCLAVYEAIKWEKLQPQLMDIDENLNGNYFDLDEQVKVLIIQNTFGFPQKEITQLQNFCRQKKIVLIEDGAHCFGASYDNGQRVGTVGELAIFSSSQDKILDSVAGGILIDNRLKSQKQQLPTKEVPMKQQFKDRVYPLLTLIIRKTYDWQVGKILHRMSKELNLLSQPMKYDNEGSWQKLPLWQVRLLGKNLTDIEDELKNRRTKLKKYQKSLKVQNWFWQMNAAEIDKSAPLRIPIKVEAKKRNELLKKLAKNGYYLSDFWYDAPIAPKRHIEEKGYQIKTTHLKKAKLTAETIINLPVHQDIDFKDIENISEILNSIQDDLML